jgi:Sulfotransferase family
MLKQLSKHADATRFQTTRTCESGPKQGLHQDPPTPTGRFFIAGCQRSGTTLVRLILECHPEVFCFDETEGYKVLMQSHCQPPAGTSLVGFKVPRYTEQFGEPLAADFGLEETATNLYQSDPILFMLRDVRDTVASMIRLKSGETCWLEVRGRSILDAKIADPAFRAKYEREIAQVEEADNSPAAVGALYWKYKTRAYLDYRERGFPILDVVYKDLVTTPEPVLRRVLSFLRLTWHPAVLEHSRFSHREVAPCGLTVGLTDPKRSIDLASVDRWKSILTPKDVWDIWKISGDLMADLRLA